jgi:hypothetical protein
MMAAGHEPPPDQAAETGLCVHYQGLFQPHTVQALGMAVRQRLVEASVPQGLRRRLFSAVVEMAHNVMHYGCDRSGRRGAGVGVLTVGLDPASNPGEAVRGGWILCANPVHREDVERIGQRMERLRAMSREETQACYRRQLLNDEHARRDPHSRGSGLGLLTIARDSRQPLEYAFVSTGEPADERVIFVLHARL